jgi:hypothetical protein
MEVWAAKTQKNASNLVAAHWPIRYNHARFSAVNAGLITCRPVSLEYHTHAMSAMHVIQDR